MRFTWTRNYNKHSVFFFWSPVRQYWQRQRQCNEATKTPSRSKNKKWNEEQQKNVSSIHKTEHSKQRDQLAKRGEINNEPNWNYSTFMRKRYLFYSQISVLKAWGCVVVIRLSLCFRHLTFSLFKCELIFGSSLILPCFISVAVNRGLVIFWPRIRELTTYTF